MVDRVQQFSNLSAEAMQSTSLSRICCRSFDLDGAPFLSWETLGILFRPVDGARLSKLTWYEDISAEWELISFTGFDSLEINVISLAPSRYLDFPKSLLTSRNPSLSLIKVIGSPSSQPLPFRLLPPLPCMNELYEAATAEGVEDSIQFDGLTIERKVTPPGLQGGNEKPSPWCIHRAFLTLTKAGVLSLPLFTKAAPFTDLLSIEIEDTVHPITIVRPNIVISRA